MCAARPCQHTSGGQSRDASAIFLRLPSRHQSNAVQEDRQRTAGNRQQNATSVADDVAARTPQQPERNMIAKEPRIIGMCARFASDGVADRGARPPSRNMIVQPTIGWDRARAPVRRTRISRR
jgi:hypothetical protein